MNDLTDIEFNKMISEASSKDAIDKYHSIFDGLDDRRKEMVRTAISMFNSARATYLEANDTGKPSGNRAFGAASCAYQFHCQLEYFKSISGTDDNSVAEKIQSISDWLERKEYIHLPEYRNKENSIKRVTAHGMIKDMQFYRNSASVITDEVKSIRNGETK